MTLSSPVFRSDAIDTQQNSLAAYDRASSALMALIRGDRSDSTSHADRRRRVEAKLARTRSLLAALGNPHLRYPVVHVTGTSGKGSTCAAITAALTDAGYRVGLKTSPYLQVATEKIQLGPALIDAPSLARLSADVIATGRRLFPSDKSGERLGYAESWAGVSFSWFAEQNVDIAVVEVGAGGRFDTTNVVEPLVSVITSVGLDHVISLGPTLADIAWHKAGIIKPGAPVVVGELPDEARQVVHTTAKTAGVSLIDASTIDLGPKVTLGMRGAFQQANLRVASAALECLRAQGFALPDNAIASGFRKARLPGRLELMPETGHGQPRVWIDGAHNADKISALAREVPSVSGGALPVLVLGALASKDARAMVATLGPVASAIVVSQPTVRGKRSFDSNELGAVVRASGFAGELLVEPDPLVALARAEAIATRRQSSVLVAGSLYLAGEIRRRWYPDAEIIVQRTPWPNLERSDYADPERSVAR
jgi:dihydrofolate synthase/folylpolyglutamate synthase